MRTVCTHNTSELRVQLVHLAQIHVCTVCNHIECAMCSTRFTWPYFSRKHHVTDQNDLHVDKTCVHLCACRSAVCISMADRLNVCVHSTCHAALIISSGTWAIQLHEKGLEKSSKVGVDHFPSFRWQNTHKDKTEGLTSVPRLSSAPAQGCMNWNEPPLTGGNLNSAHYWLLTWRWGFTRSTWQWLAGSELHMAQCYGA